MDRIYCDYAATTPVDLRVLEAMEPYFSRIYGNASSIHAAGREAKAALEAARASLARCIGAQPGEVVFTSGGTESDNAAIAGALRAAPANGRRGIVTAAAEHHAVLSPCEEIGRTGYPVTVLPVDRHGIVERDALNSALKKNPLLVSLMYGNNEVGALTPLRHIFGPVHEAGALLHTDAVQCLGKVPVDVNGLGTDFMTLTAHKVYGPKGIGALYIRSGTPWSPVLYGGGQERGRRPGTENVALAVGFARAAELAVESMAGDVLRLAAIRNELEGRVRKEFPEVIVNSTAPERLPTILNFSFDSARLPMEGEMLVVNLDLAGISASSGSACTSGSVQPSHVLLAMGRSPATAAAAVRFSFGRMSSPEDCERVMTALNDTVRRMRYS